MKWVVMMMALLVLGGCEKAAYYILQPDDLEREDLGNYGLFVCNPAIDPEVLRAKFPDATLLAAFSSHSYPLWGQGNEFWDTYRSYFTAGDVTDISTFHNTLELHLNDRTSQVLAFAILDLSEGYDGVYLDDCWGTPPPWFQNATGTPEKVWYRHLETLFETLGEDVPVVGNVGGRSDLTVWMPLAGVTVESRHVKTEMEKDRANDAFSRYKAGWNVSWNWQGKNCRVGVNEAVLEGE